MARGNRRLILIRGLEPGSAYLAYLFSKAGERVVIQTADPSDVYLYDVPPAPLFLRAKLLSDVMLVEFAETADPKSFDVVVDSCDIVGVEEVVKAYGGREVVAVEGDPWLSATLSLYRGLPLPDFVDLPLQKTSTYSAISLRYLRYSGGAYSLCEAADGLSGKGYTPLRALERLYLAADVFKAVEGLGATAKPIRLEYAVGKDVFYMAVGAEPRGKASKINLEDISITAYGEGGALTYLFLRGRAQRFEWALAVYNSLRLDPLSFLYDVGLSRGPLNVAGSSHLLRALRRGEKI
ncbi:MAG: hypothetical protein TU35_009935 [Thermoproteus sp. AZ2]|uniref:Uncharacterized protein n=1 Tax=Thermoproteus sp. AZ2 TaxID=1609232 RepID=A0ACC6V395_9CREN